MKRAVGKNEKLDIFKLESLKLESFAEVGKNRLKLERTERSWKVSLKFESFAAVGVVAARAVVRVVGVGLGLGLGLGL